MRSLNGAAKSRAVPRVASLGDVFKPGDAILHSGIYRVLHDSAHQEPHDVTCLHGRRFPSCRCCDFPRFILIRGAEAVDANDHFRGAELRDRRRRSGW